MHGSLTKQSERRAISICNSVVDNLAAVVPLRKRNINTITFIFTPPALLSCIPRPILHGMQTYLGNLNGLLLKVSIKLAVHCERIYGNWGGP